MLFGGAAQGRGLLRAVIAGQQLLAPVPVQVMTGREEQARGLEGPDEDALNPLGGELGRGSGFYVSDEWSTPPVKNSVRLDWERFTDRRILRFQ